MIRNFPLSKFAQIYQQKHDSLFVGAERAKCLLWLPIYFNRGNRLVAFLVMARALNQVFYHSTWHTMCICLISDVSDECLLTLHRDVNKEGVKTFQPLPKLKNRFIGVYILIYILNLFFHRHNPLCKIILNTRDLWTGTWRLSTVSKTFDVKSSKRLQSGPTKNHRLNDVL